MLAAGFGYAIFYQVAPGSVGNQIVRVVEESGVSLKISLYLYLNCLN